jgi:hypothetical protein
MAFIDFGLSVLSAEQIADFPLDEPFDLASIYHMLSIQGNLAGHEVFERFYEIGSHQGLKETIEFLRQGE